MQQNTGEGTLMENQAPLHGHPPDGACTCRHPDQEMDARFKEDMLRRLSRAEGQIRGIKAMVERDEYCDDVLNQLAAARAALKSISLRVLQGHVQTCLVRKVKNDENEIIDELLATINKMM